MNSGYYQAVPTEQVPLRAVSNDGDDGVHVAFDREAGFNYLCMLPSLFVPCCAPLFAVAARKHMDSQKCTITDRRVVFESGWLDRSHKSIPLDRIQDVNVRQDCVQACLGLQSLEIQTAGTGGPRMEPEAKLIAPVDAMIVRDIIMDRRDALVLGSGRVISDSLPAAQPRVRSNKNHGDASNVAVVDELRSIKDTLVRLEAQVKVGVDHVVRKQV